MKKSEAILISAYTGFMLVKDFSEVHEFIEKTLDRPVFTHELAEGSPIHNELHKKLLPQLQEIVDNLEE